MSLFCYPPLNKDAGMSERRKFCTLIIYNRLPRKLEKCRISQDILCRTMCLERRCTLCTASERHAVRRKRDKKDGASEVSEEV